MPDNQIPLQNPQNFFKIMTVIHAAMIIGIILFGIVAYSITPGATLNLKPAADPFFYIVPLFVLAGMFLGTSLYGKQVARAATAGTVKEKLGGYQTAAIIRYALAEGPALLGIVAFLLNANLVYLVLVGVDVIYFIWIRPTKDKIKDDLNLSYEDEMAM